jgi:hypothetical protein
MRGGVWAPDSWTRSWPQGQGRRARRGLGLVPRGHPSWPGGIRGQGGARVSDAPAGGCHAMRPAVGPPPMALFFNKKFSFMPCSHVQVHGTLGS